jgi:hypothetical protein
VIGNNSGVHLYRTETGKSYSFGYDDGYIPIQVSSRSIVSTNDKNAVWIIHNTGISYFDYNKLNELKTSGNLLFTSIDLFNNPYLNIDSNYVALSSDKGLYFDYDQNHISISFVGLSYHNTNSTSYRYMLEGFDKEWQKSSQINNKVVYSNLPPGEYTFLLEATFGKYNTQVVERKLKIIIDKPFWERWWFYAIQLFVLVVLFALSLYLKTRRMFLKFSTMIMILLVLILTELLVLFLEGYFERYTVGIPFLKLMVNVLMALMFSPLEKLAAKFYNSL